MPDRPIDESESAVGNLADVEEYEKVFKQYLTICNQVIERNKDKFPFTQIWKARWKELGTNNILHCAVYDDRPKVIYTLELAEDLKMKIVKKTEATTPDIWPFKYSYLKHVIDNSNQYIEHPANLDWGWLTCVFG